MTTATDEAARIRAEFRAAGFNSRDISVRASCASMCSEIRIVVRNVQAPLAWVRAVAESAKRIRRCEITGEILGGGNRYVSVEHDSGAREILSRRHADALQQAVERLSPDDPSRLEPVHGTDSHVGLDVVRDGYRLWHDTAGRVFGRHPGCVADAAYELALRDPDQLAAKPEVCR